MGFEFVDINGHAALFADHVNRRVRQATALIDIAAKELTRGRGFAPADGTKKRAQPFAPYVNPIKQAVDDFGLYEYGALFIAFAINIEETEFANKIIKTLTRINALMAKLYTDFAQKAEYRDYFQRLLYAAQNGVETSVGDLVQGEASVTSFREYFVANEGPKLRALFLKKLHLATLLFLMSALVGLVVLDPLGEGKLMLLGKDWLVPLQSLSVAILGLCLANWIYRMLSHEELNWENLRQLSSAVYPPIVRYLLLITLIITSMILLDKKIIEVTILTYNLQSLVANPEDAILLGLFAGLAEKRLTRSLLSTFADELGKD